MSTPYCLPLRRDLTEEERGLLRKLLEQTGELRGALESQIDKLKVIARCGCGQCPGVLFGFDFNDEPTTVVGSPVASLRGKAIDGVDVGAYLHVSNGKILELAAIAWSGDAVTQWPALGNMQPTGEHLPSNSVAERDARQGRPRAPRHGR